MGREPKSMRFAQERVMKLFAEMRAGIEAGTSRGASTSGEEAAQLADSNPGRKRKREDPREATHVDYVKKMRKLKYPLSEKVVAGVRYQKSLGIKVALPLFHTTNYLTFEEFETAWAWYCAEHFAAYRAIHTITTPAANRKIEEKYQNSMMEAAARGVEFTEPLLLIPSSLSHQIVTYTCVHGCIPGQPRGTGERESDHSRFFDCPARITGRATYIAEEDRWEVFVCDENRTHNHHCTLETYIANMKSSKIKDPVLLKEVETMVGVLGKSRIILDKINRVLPFSRRQLENFKANQLGGLSALEGVQGFLLRFTDFEDYLVLLIEDQDGVTIGIGLQTKIQREIFKEYGDNVILDWTHNTNNVGYYMGAFLVTTASGKGVSVFDMLCVTQSKDMMRAFFEHFIDTNQGARERVKSFVIDKDYREWEVLEEVFSQSVVVLCQFHVLKWFNFVVTQEKYAIPVALRVDVLRSLRFMVYASSEDDFTHQQQVLEDLLAAEHHQGFLKYLQDCWYNCTRMWANFVRGDVFTACNTTSNRLEAFWRRYKEDRGFRQRVDHCIEAIFLHATSVLTREKNEFVNHSTSASLRAAAVRFLEPLMRDLGEFTTKLVQLQWVFYASAPPGAYQVMNAHDPCGGEATTPTTYTVRVTIRRPVDFTVCTRLWTCTCHFFRGSLLPCRHLMYVADGVRKMEHYPVTSLASRWSMSRAARFIGDLVKAILQLSMLRSDLLPPPSTQKPATCKTTPMDATSTGASAAAVDTSDDSIDSVPETPRARDFRLKKASRSGAFAITKLKRGEVGNCVVLDPSEKHNIISAQFERLKTYMDAQGSERYRQCSIELDDAVTALINKWSSMTVSSHDDGEGSAAAKKENTTTSNGDGPQLLREARQLSDHSSDDLRAVEEPVNLEDDASWSASWNAFECEEDSYMCEEDIPVFPVWHLTAAETWRGQLRQRDTTSTQQEVFYGIAQQQQESDDVGVDEILARPENQQILRDAVAFRVRSTSFDNLMADIDCEEPFVAGHTTTTLSAPTPPVASSPAFTNKGAEKPNSALCESGGSEKTFAVGDELADESSLRRKQIYKMQVPRRIIAGQVRVSNPKKSVTGRLQTPQPAGECPVDIGDFVRALSHCTLSRASLMYPQYPVLFDDISFQNKTATASQEMPAPERLNFTVPETILRKLRAVVPSAPPSSPSNAVDLAGPANAVAHARKQFVARFTMKVRGFTREEINLLGEFDTAKDKLLWYKKDMEWLTVDGFWSVPLRHPDVGPLVPEAKGLNTKAPADPSHATKMRAAVISALKPTLGFLVDETEGLDDDDPDDPFHTTKMREAIICVLKPTSLQATLSLPSYPLPLGLTQDPVKNRRLVLGDLFGRLARTEWLNDSVMNFAINMLAAPFADVVVVDSLNFGKIVCPRKDAGSARLVVFPIFFPLQQHWCSVCVLLNWKTGCHTAFGYDPDRVGAYEAKVKEVWKGWCLPLLRAWTREDEVFSHDDAPLNFVGGHKQIDNHSCGVHVILYMHNWMWNRVPVADAPSLQPFAVQVLRLRIMWLIVYNSTLAFDREREKEANAYADKFDAYVGTDGVDGDQACSGPNWGSLQESCRFHKRESSLPRS